MADDCWWAEERGGAVESSRDFTFVLRWARRPGNSPVSHPALSPTTPALAASPRRLVLELPRSPTKLNRTLVPEFVMLFWLPWVWKYRRVLSHEPQFGDINGHRQGTGTGLSGCATWPLLRPTLRIHSTKISGISNHQCNDERRILWRKGGQPHRECTHL